MLYQKSYKKILVMLLVSFFVSGTAVATTLISSSGDGGFETGATSPANGWVAVNGDSNAWYVGGAPVSFAGTNCAFTGPTASSWVGQAVQNVNMFYRDITVPAGESNLNLTFMY